MMMNNPIYQALMQRSGVPDIMTQVARLKQTIKGDPMNYIQQMLNSGQISQAQYNSAVQRAQQLQGLFRR